MTVIACLAAAALLVVSVNAQTLARPGWTGSGMNTEPWWRSAIFYRIAPEHFQDSDGDGVGDLGGIALRLDYLQALGVDAVVLQLPFDDTGFDDLLEEASRRHIRLVIGLDRGAVPDDDKEGKDGKDKESKDKESKDKESKPGQALTAEASHWFLRGAAGILLPPPPQRPEASDPAEQMRRDIAEQLLLLTLRRAAAQLPGERVVIPEAAPVPLRASEPKPLSSPSPRQGTRALRPDNPQLVLGTLPVRAAGVASLSASQVVAALTAAMPGDGAPLLQLQMGEPGAHEAGTSSDSVAAVAAAALLTQRSAVLLEFGQELGRPSPDRMPWTPGNVTAPPEPAAAAVKLPMAAASPTVYGPYRPYVPPPPKPNPKPSSPAVSAEAALPDPGTLPGFSAKALPEGESSSEPTGTAAGSTTAEARTAAATGVRSVVLQERDPRSLLNLYRRLAALHHGNATMRSGSLAVLHTGDDAGDDTVVWLRRTPVGARTAAPVIVAGNCSDHAVTLSVERELAQLSPPAVRGGELRSLLPGAAGAGIMSVHALTLAPHGIFVGEIVSGR